MALQTALLALVVFTILAVVIGFLAGKIITE